MTPSSRGDVGDAWRALLLGAPPALLELGIRFVAPPVRAGSPTVSGGN